jgi:hypothetical protein
MSLKKQGPAHGYRLLTNLTPSRRMATAETLV